VKHWITSREALVEKIFLLLVFCLLFVSSLKSGDTEIFLSLKRDSTSYQLPYSYGSSVEHYKVKEDKITDSLKLSPSVFVKENSEDYGVSLISIRGFTSNQTSVVYDGFKFPKDLTQTYDLSILPPASSSEVYLLKGGWSSVYGSDSEGGVVAIKTQDLKPNTQTAVLNVERGSYNSDRYYIKSGFSKDKFFIITEAENYSSNGFQENSSANKNSLIMKLGYDFDDYGKLTLSGFGVKLKTDLPSGTPVDVSQFNGKREKKANTPYDWQDNENIFLSFKHQLEIDDTKLTISYARNNITKNAYQWSALTNIKTYSDDFMLNMSFNQLNLGFELDKNYLRSDDYGNHSIENYGYFINSNKNIGSDLKVYWYLRYDNNKNYSDVLSHRFATEYFLTEDISLSYAVSKSWRSPSFADIYGSQIYWIPPNPYIKPEKSLGNELSMKLSLNNFELTVSGYYYDITDKISYDPLTYRAVNLAEGYNKGIEGLSSYNIDLFKFSIGGNIMRVMGRESGGYKTLPYIPEYKFVFITQYQNIKLFDIVFKTERYGKYFTMPEKKGKEVPSYTISSISITRKISDLKIFLSVDNIFNERYATNADSFNGYFPGKPRNINAGASINF
jgi:vitamin B12 transporter